MITSESTLPGRGFALTLRAENADVWEAMQQHRFVTDIVADRLDPNVFRRYLIFEHSFVETAILIFGHAMLKAPAFSQRRRLIGVLHSLAEDQITYFVHVFAVLGLGLRPAEPVVPEAAHQFDNGMLKIAESGSYADILTIMLAAEWMYGTWCLRAAQTRIGQPQLRDWVMLHTKPAFLDGVMWLMSEINREAVALDGGGRQRLSALFGHALRLEIAFHEAAFETCSIPLVQEAPR